MIQYESQSGSRDSIHHCIIDPRTEPDLGLGAAAAGQRHLPRALPVACRVREGAGLVWVRPFESELTPLVPEEPAGAPRGPYTTIEPGRAESSASRDILTGWPFTTA